MSQGNFDTIRGIFSLQEMRKVGTGTTVRKVLQKTFWYVESDVNTQEIEVQSLNSNYIPTGIKRTITREELIAKYTPEMEFYVQTVYPKMQEVNQGIKDGDARRENGELFSAEFEYENVLKVDEENVRANFGIGLTYLEQGETAKAENIFSRLVELEAPFTREHRHLFNDFGINLRKSKMYKEALSFYQRAVDLGQVDENLYLNMARVHMEQAKFDMCLKYIGFALRLDKDNAIATKMIEWLLAKDKITGFDIEEMHKSIAQKDIIDAQEELKEEMQEESTDDNE